MNDADALALKLAQQNTVRSETGQFVRMDGRFAVVNIGTSTVTIPCIGVYPPRPGLPVRVEWVNGSPAVKGLVTPQNPFGTISAAGTPRASVLVDGETYELYVMDAYTPTVGDSVAVDWDRYLILGKVSGIDTPAVPGESGGGVVAPFDVTVLASGSGRYQPPSGGGGGWWSNDPRASSNNQGIWVYGSRILDAVGTGVVSEAYVFLPLRSQVGLASIGVHDHPAIPGGAPYIFPASLTALPFGGRNGWVPITAPIAQYLAAGGRGLGVLAPGGNGDTVWRGTASDAMSGAVRLVGTR